MPGCKDCFGAVTWDHLQWDRGEQGCCCSWDLCYSKPCPDPAA